MVPVTTTTFVPVFAPAPSPPKPETVPPDFGPEVVTKPIADHMDNLDKDLRGLASTIHQFGGHIEQSYSKEEHLAVEHVGGIKKALKNFVDNQDKSLKELNDVVNLAA